MPCEDRSGLLLPELSSNGCGTKCLFVSLMVLFDCPFHSCLRLLKELPERELIQERRCTLRKLRTSRPGLFVQGSRAFAGEDEKTDDRADEENQSVEPGQDADKRNKLIEFNTSTDIETQISYASVMDKKYEDIGMVSLAPLHYQLPYLREQQHAN